ncbi:protein FAR1-RELATED SEQUENCE 5-like [Spinacia oleracea]|uniref:Protein FAR1-RELATED SEQUENCE 5-like n=1 Tax=Spinacia oleracea TaxID=3562 RepID=A0ABM3QQJ4_SPIOL|nr:protein FAR1-RELATED SEQUENCE 5-like [Spinacia oleracea]
MPFAPFIGVNHHGKSIIFAAALISHEDAPTFVWVFEEFMKCMALGSRKDWPKIDTLIRTAIHDLLDPDEFDEAWCHVMEEYGLTGPGWMKDAYELRCQWAPAYNRGKFWAGMSSTQRSEAEEEKQNNYDSIDKIPRLEPDKSVLVEYVLVKSYTNEKFAEVVAERKGLTHTNVTKIDALGNLSFYRADEKLTSPLWRKRFKQYNVKVDKVKGELHCSCNLFEFTGILCRHILEAMDVEDFQFLPEKYILPRWMKQVRSYESLQVSYFDPLESSRLAKAKELSQRHNYLYEMAMRSEVALKLYKEAMDVVRLKMEDAIGIRKTGDTGDDSILWWDPDARNRHTGRAKTKRNSAFDKSAAGPSKKNQTTTQEELVAKEALIYSAFGNIPSYCARREHATNVAGPCLDTGLNNGVLFEDIPQGSQIKFSQDNSQPLSNVGSYPWCTRLM